MAWALDLDGVLWLGDHPIPGAAEAVNQLRAAGEDLAFVTNNSFGTRDSVASKLIAHGIEPGDDVVTSSMAGARLVEPGERVLVCGGPGVVESLVARGAEVVRPDDATATKVDAVMMGYNPAFDYALMTTATLAVQGGARLLATNDDATYPTLQGSIPGGGALLASVERATGTTAEVAGKPYGPMCDLVRDRLGPDGIMVGDRPDTDGRFAVALGYRFALVLSGVTTRSDLPVDPVPDLVAPDLTALVRDQLRT